MIVMLDERLKYIKLELSYLEIRKKYNLSPLLVENHEDMTDSEKINHMLILIQHGLDLPDPSDDSDDSDESDESDDPYVPEGVPEGPDVPDVPEGPDVDV